MSLTDDVYGQMMSKVSTEAPQMARSATEAAGNIARGGVAGIALVFKAPTFTAEFIMKAVGKMIGNPQYASQNIAIEDLEKNSDIRKIDTEMTKEQMKHFNDSCKKLGVKYSAVVNRSDNGEEPTYYVFFKGKEALVVEQAMKEAYQSYIKEQANPKLSVKARLAFFRDRVATRDQAQQDKERHHNKADIQR